jgi:hypothetical protein
MMDEGDYGAIGGIKIGRGNRSTHTFYRRINNIMGARGSVVC